VYVGILLLDLEITHTKQSKAYRVTAAITQLSLPIVPMLGPVPQVLKPCAANPPGAGLVTHMRTV